jgi:hypothetical protein
MAPLIPFSTYPRPNEPPCPHPALVHDIEDWEDMVPRCCAEGCGCGAREQPGSALAQLGAIGVTMAEMERRGLRP